MLNYLYRKFIHEEKIFDKEISKIYDNIFQLRQRSDYDTEYPTDIELTKKLLIDANVFIETVRKII